MLAGQLDFSNFTHILNWTVQVFRSNASFSCFSYWNEVLNATMMNFKMDY